MNRILTALALLCAIPAGAFAENEASTLASPLAGLAQPHAGVAAHQGSWDRQLKNNDWRTIEAGQTLPLFDEKGAGIIRRFWVVWAPNNTEFARQMIIRMYWDGESSPSVEAPIGDFFGVGFGEQRDFVSLPLNQTSGGFNCYWPMPFHRSARWTVTNMSTHRLDAIYWNVDYTKLKSLPKSTRHFHAQYRRENPTTQGKSYTILETTGEGHFVGTLLSMQNLRSRNLGFLEGNEIISIDGEAKPSIIGTGTEDYFSGAYYFMHGPYSAPFHGATIVDEKQARISAYRWHIEDAMPFTKSIKVTIEHGAENSVMSDYSSVALWYQTEPHTPFSAIPQTAAGLLATPPVVPFRLANAIEGEDLVAKASATEGTVTVQPMESYVDRWSGDAQLWWQPKNAGAVLTIPINAPADGEYMLSASLTKAADYGIAQFAVAGTPVGSPIDLYHNGVVSTGMMLIGRVTLHQGSNPVTVRVTGKNPTSTGYLVGIDAFTLTPVR